MTASARLVVVDDDPSMRDLLTLRLGQRGVEATCFETATEALERIEDLAPDAVITDIRMDGMDGITLCEHIAARTPNIPVIVMTGHSDFDTVIAALRARAFDYLPKPIDIDALFTSLDAALRFRAARAAVPRLADSPASVTLENAVGESPSIKRVFDLVARVAQADTTALITGESGTGKELVARALHQQSRRKSGPFVTVNCSAVPETLLEAELFGHAKGAFTDARGDRRGLFEQAQGGTLLLDEIGEMPLHLQPKLLRAIQERVVRPIGGMKEIPFDVRIVAATHQDLQALVTANRFREDLFYRLNVVEICVPPLRERGSDVLLCAQKFVDRYARSTSRGVLGVTPEACERLLSYSWPGNVRELQNVMERAVLLTRHQQVTVEDLPENIQRYRSSPRSNESERELVSLEELEAKHIARVLEATGGNKTLAAQILGIDRRTLYRRNERTPKPS